MSTLPPNPNIQAARKKITTQAIRQKKERGEPITMLTGYDYPMALALDQAGIDAILVGDSLGMVVLGYENTLPVTMEEMLHHCRAVARGAKSALLIGDMPFMSYQVSIEEAVRNAGRFLQEGGMEAVKLEGGGERANAVRAIVGAGILQDAILLEEAGCFSLVLESVPGRLAEMVSKRISIPTIGIGAGIGCDGQVLVTHDLLGLFDRFTPKFVRKYANLHDEMENAFKAFIADVQEHNFPAKEHTVEMPDAEWEALAQNLKH
jgi:3-methyl-2-oxobutanoate hydroxymethyltransferase